MADIEGEMDDLEKRVARLEAVKEVERLWIDFADAMDFGGPEANVYDPDKMLSLIAEDSSSVVGVVELGSKEAIGEFWRDLAQSMSLHFMSNPLIDISGSLESAVGSWRAWETPILDDQSLLGVFSHAHEYTKVDGRWLRGRAVQTTHFFVPLGKDWAGQDRVIEQRRSFI